jgi:hypothetical protein
MKPLLILLVCLVPSPSWATDPASCPISPRFKASVAGAVAALGLRGMGSWAASASAARELESDRIFQLFGEHRAEYLRLSRQMPSMIQDIARRARQLKISPPGTDAQAWLAGKTDAQIVEALGSEMATYEQVALVRAAQAAEAATGESYILALGAQRAGVGLSSASRVLGVLSSRVFITASLITIPTDFDYTRLCGRDTDQLASWLRMDDSTFCACQRLVPGASGRISEIAEHPLKFAAQVKQTLLMSEFDQRAYLNGADGTSTRGVLMRATEPAVRKAAAQDARVAR